MRQFLVTVAGVFAGLLLFFIGLPIVLFAVVAASVRSAPAPARSVLSLDLRQSLPDQDPQNPFAAFGSRSLSVMSVVQSLHRAQADDRVKGLLIRLPEQGLPPGAADEIRLAVKAFRASGKPVIAHSQGLYASGAAPSTYMLGAAADQFWMQPDASLQAVGMASEDVFMKRLFDKYGVTADYQQRYEYKNAVNPFLYDDYTPAHREATLGWMGSVYLNDVAVAASDRRSAPASLRGALEAGPYVAEEARTHGLVDRIGEVRDAEQSLLGRAGAGASLVDLNSYRSPRRDRAAGDGATIAVIQAEGDIVTGASQNGGLNQGQAIYSDDLAQAFYDAAKEKSVKAIVFRVSSPGGSDTASEQILAGVRAAKAAGKPVVVSMGTYAASGGYWISCQASEIVAEPTTLTGSIGVFGGKFALGQALGRYGVDMRSLSVGGDFADAFGSGAPFTPSQRAKVSAWMDHIYDGFVARVAEGRKLSPDRVREIAKGRVWTGRQAVALGLVDKLGGFYDAVAEAKRLGGVAGGQEVRLKLMPARRSPFDVLQRALGMSTESAHALASVAWLASDPRAQSALAEFGRARGGIQANTVLAPTPRW